MGKNYTIISERPLYGNYAVYSPNNILMFYSNKRKLDFYIKKDLVEQIDEKSFRLKFQPNGLGYSDERSRCKKECLIQRINRCVVTGDTNFTNLSKHHIVPRWFRQHMPFEFKSSFQTVVLLRRDKHCEYTIQEQAFYNVLAEKYGVPMPHTFGVKIYKNSYVRRIARSLFLYGHKIPEANKLEMKLAYMSETGLEPTMDNLRLTANEIEDNNKIKKTNKNDFAIALMERVTDYREFEELWINHFIEHAKPIYLPEDLIITYNLQDKIKSIT